MAASWYRSFPGSARLSNFAPRQRVGRRLLLHARTGFACSWGSDPGKFKMSGWHCFCSMNLPFGSVVCSKWIHFSILRGLCIASLSDPPLSEESGGSLCRNVFCQGRLSPVAVVWLAFAWGNALAKVVSWYAIGLKWVCYVNPVEFILLRVNPFGYCFERGKVQIYETVAGNSSRDACSGSTV